MNIAQLTTRAVRVRKLYAERAIKQRSTPWTRAEIAQGFVGDLGDLTKLVMAKEGRRTSKTKNLDDALAHELADCLWSVLVLSDAYTSISKLLS
jgi:hypothetical protein